MLSRRAPLALVALLAIGLSGCMGTPAPSTSPTPTATGFASEEEAFAAAEETYRAHLDDLNAYYAGDTDYEPSDYLTGKPLTDERDLLNQMQELGLRVEGEIVLASLDRVEATEVSDAWSVKLQSCLDSSGTRILDRDGADVTPERDETITLDVELATNETGRFSIVESVVSEDEKC